MNPSTCEEYLFQGLSIRWSHLLCPGAKDGNPDPSFSWQVGSPGAFETRKLVLQGIAVFETVVFSTCLNCHISCTAQVRVQVEKGHLHYRNARLLQIPVSCQVSHLNRLIDSRPSSTFHLTYIYGFHTVFQVTSPMPLASIFPHLHCGHMQPSDLPTLSCRNALAFPLFAERQFGHSKHIKGETHHL